MASDGLKLLDEASRFPNSSLNQNPSDDDDDEHRLMIDTSEDEDSPISKIDSSKNMHHRSMIKDDASEESRGRGLAFPPFHDTNHSLNELTKNMALPGLNKLMEDVAREETKNGIRNPSFISVLEKVKKTPEFQKLILEMEVPPDIEKVLDGKMMLQQSQGLNPDPKISTLGCEKKTKESNSEKDPLLKLQDFVKKPWNAYPGDVLPNSISSTSASGSQGCETVPISSMPTSSSKLKCTKSRSTIKRNGAQLPYQQRKSNNTLPSKSKSVKPPEYFTNSVGRLPSAVSRTPPPSTIDFVLKKLNNAARDEQQMRDFRRMSTSDEFDKFRKFQTYLNTHYKDLSLHPPPFGQVSDRPALNQKMSYSIPAPPALTIIPKQGSQPSTTCKTTFRRDPPPMVPIESFASLRRPFNEDHHLLLRLKRLGTDIELERTTPVSAPMQMDIDHERSVTEDDDNDTTVFPLLIDYTEPIVTIDETPDPLPLKCFDVDPKLLKKSQRRAHAHPPLPSLIPLPSCSTSTNVAQNKYVPSLPSVSRVNSETVPSKINKKPKRKQKTAVKSEKSEISKLAHALVQPAGAIKNNEVEIVNTFCRPSKSQNSSISSEREIEIFKIEEGQSEKITNREENNTVRLIRLEDDAVESKTTNECTFFEGFSKKDVDDGLIETPVQTTKNSVISEPVIDAVEDVVNETLSGGIEAVIESSTMPNETNKDEATEDEAILQSEENTIIQELPTAAESSLFSFQSEDAIVTNLIPGGRKMFICKICSGVYCKMYSAKKHYYRNHINPRMVTEKDALMFGLETHAEKLPANEGLYRCNECKEIFVEIADLKRHLLVHPVVLNENPERSRRNSTSYYCDSCSTTFLKKKLYSKHMLNCPGNKASSSPEASASREDQSNPENFDDEKNNALGISRMCLFCDVTFTSAVARKTHVLQEHPPKKRNQSCSYCKCRQFNDLKLLLKHICKVHSKRYFGCSDCKIRFKTKDDLTAHNAESHAQPESTGESSKTNQSQKGKTVSSTITKSGRIFKCAKCSKTFPTGKELNRHRKKGHNIAKQTRTSGNSSDFSEQKNRTTNAINVDYETEYYRNVAENVRINFEFYLDGKLPDTAAPNDLKTCTRSGVSLHLKTRRSVSQQLRAERDTLPTWLNLQDMYGATNLNGTFIANVSRLHLATQLEVLRKANLLKNEPKIESASTNHQTSTIMAEELALTKNSGSSDFIEETENNSEAVFTGEWTRPKKYICSTCFARFNNFWDMDDHRWIKHSNVYFSYYEFPVDQAPGANWAMKRSLSNIGLLSSTSENSRTSNSPATKCTKCQKVVTPAAEFHKHILECGGDTTWASTMFASFSFKKNKKWKPYGSRRRRNVGRVRGLKRNIPTTPIKIIGLNKNRQKAGDSESIQRMIANLPPKRITRRIIQFDDVESKSQNRKAVVSNILTRRRKGNPDGKTSAQASKSLETSDFISVKMPDTQKKKKQTLTKKLKVLKSMPSNSPVTVPVEQPETTSDTTLVNSDPSTLNNEETSSAVDNNASESSIELPPANDAQDVELDSSPKPENVEPKADLSTCESGDADSSLPDSSVILAAMRERVRQTDEVMPSQTFLVTSKKRKRDDTKCKQESDVKQPLVESKTKCVSLTTVACVECNNTFTNSGGNVTHVCEKCASKRCKTRSASIRDKERENKPQEVRKSQCKIKQVSQTENTLQSSDNEKLSISETVEEDSMSQVSMEEDTRNARSKKSLSKVKKNINACKTTKAAKREKINRNIRTSRNNETSNSTDKPEINELDKNRTDESVEKCGMVAKRPKIDDSCENTDILETNNDTKILLVEDSKVHEISRIEKHVDAVSKSTSSKVLDISQNVEDTKPTIEVGKDTESKVMTCKVCHCLSIRPVCDNCSCIARKNKICAFCKQTLAPKSNTLPICDTCKISQYVTMSSTNIEGKLLPKRELLEWILCKVCRRTNHKVVCSSCVVMSQKHKICARCNVRWEDPKGTGMPVCPPCEKEWYLPVIDVNDVVDKCTECSILHATKVTMQKPCSKCNTTSITKKLSESVSIYHSNKISVQMNNEETVCSTIPAPSETASPKLTTVPQTSRSMSAIQISGSVASTSTDSVCLVAPSTSTVTSLIPSTMVCNSTPPVVIGNVSNISTPAVNKTIIEESQNNVSQPKKNVILICKGCYGLYDKVSTYKQHCDTCLARVSKVDEKKPLLGFVKRNTNVVSNEVNNGGASFEILEGVQIKSYPLSEAEKIESDSINEISSVPVSVCDSDSSTSSKRPELGKKPKTKRSIATDESINETIQSVIMTVCYDTVPSKDSSGSDFVPKTCNSEPSPIETEISSSNLEKFEKVKNELKSSLETSVIENEMNTEISFLNDVQTHSENVSIDSKKTRMKEPFTWKKNEKVTKTRESVPSKKKERVTNRLRTTRSSLTKLDTDTSIIPDEISKTNGKTCRKRKVNSECLLQKEETSEKITPTDSTAIKSRRKPTVKTAGRTLRSRKKVGVRDGADESKKVEEDSTEQKSSDTPNRMKEEPIIDQNLRENQEEIASTDEEDEITKTRCKKQKIDLTSDLGFAVMKTNKPTRRNVKRDSSESLDSIPKNELGESDRNICESDVICSKEPTLNCDTTNETPIAASLDYSDSSRNPSDFLEAAPTPSTLVLACDESVTLSGFSYDDSVRADGYNATGPPNFEGQPDEAQSTSWYNAIDFLNQSSLGSILNSVEGGLGQCSLGSILDSVNELLSRPEVASSCIADTIVQPLTDPQNDEMVLHSLDDSTTRGHDGFLNQEDEAPTLIDLDHQTAHHSKLKAKEDEKSNFPNKDASPSENSSSTKEICEVCDQSYPDLKSLEMHMSNVHKTSVPTTRSAANGKLRVPVRNNLNGVKLKQKCSHCQKILASKAEMVSHLKEHPEKFTSNKNNPEYIKESMGEKLRDIFLKDAMEFLIRKNSKSQSPQESAVRDNPSLKMITQQLKNAKKNQFGVWKSTIAQVLKLGSSLAAVSPDEAGKSSSNEAIKSSSNGPPTAKSNRQSKKLVSSSSVSKSDSTSTDSILQDEYPCPMCSAIFKYTCERNSHLIMVHAPRQSTHKPTVENVENGTRGKNDKSGPSSDSSIQPDNKKIQSYLLNDSVNSCLEAKKEAVNKAIAESCVNEKQLSGLTSFSKKSLHEEPPALEPAASGEQVPNNMDRSPPKLEASAGLPVQPVRRQNPTSTPTNNTNPPVLRNGKPCRKKMSKKEMNLPPSVVKYKAEQALLELSINKFKRYGRN